MYGSTATLICICSVWGCSPTLATGHCDRDSLWPLITLHGCSAPQVQVMQLPLRCSFWAPDLNVSYLALYRNHCAGP